MAGFAMLFPTATTPVCFLYPSDTLGTLQAVQQFVGMPCYDFSEIAEYWEEGGVPQRPTQTWSEWVSASIAAPSILFFSQSDRPCLVCFLESSGT